MFHPSPLESRAILQLFGRIAKFKPTLSRNCSSLVRGLEGRLSGSDIGKRYFSHPIRATRPLREDATATEEALVSGNPWLHLHLKAALHYLLYNTKSFSTTFK